MQTQEITVCYEGGSWKISSENINKIRRYASILKDSPELLTFLQGFLFQNSNFHLGTQIATTWGTSTILPLHFICTYTAGIQMSSQWIRESICKCVCVSKCNGHKEEGGAGN